MDVSLNRVVPLLCASLMIGCQSTPDRPVAPGAVPFKKGASLKPNVAVMDMENRANFDGQWNLGRGMADMLITSLMETEKVTVLERQNLSDVLSEQNLQSQGLVRKEGVSATGRLKNAKYLVRGAVTDFTPAEGVSGWFGKPGWRIFGGGQRALVSLHLRVFDVESGEVMASVKATGSSHSGDAGAEGQYKNMNFGGRVFKRTPLGKATEKALTDAVRQILSSLPIDYWRPLVADARGNLITVNGGEEAGVTVGDVFLVRESPRKITDPATGNVIDVVPGEVTGKIRVTRIAPLAASAELLEGSAERGQGLELVVPEEAK